jgi:hypothetical protein
MPAVPVRRRRKWSEGRERIEKEEVEGENKGPLHPWRRWEGDCRWW